MWMLHWPNYLAVGCASTRMARSWVEFKQDDPQATCLKDFKATLTMMCQKCRNGRLLRVLYTNILWIYSKKQLSVSANTASQVVWRQSPTWRKSGRHIPRATRLQWSESSSSWVPSHHRPRPPCNLWMLGVLVNEVRWCKQLGMCYQRWCFFLHNTWLQSRCQTTFDR